MSGALPPTRAKLFHTPKSFPSKKMGGRLESQGTRSPQMTYQQCSSALPSSPVTLGLEYTAKRWRWINAQLPHLSQGDGCRRWQHHHITPVIWWPYQSFLSIFGSRLWIMPPCNQLQRRNGLLCLAHLRVPTLGREENNNAILDLPISMLGSWKVEPVKLLIPNL